MLASLGPIVAFFSASTTSYPFMVLLNVVVFGAAGMLGLVFLLQTLHRLNVVMSDPPAEAVGEEKPEGPSPGALDVMDRQVLEPSREDGLPLLGDPVRRGWSADGLGAAAVPGEPRPAVLLVSRS